MLLFEADLVIRDFIPTAFSLIGKLDLADNLRNLKPIESIRAIHTALKLLENQSSPELDDLCFWCEAAIWAAIDNKKSDYDLCMKQAIISLPAEVYIN